MQVIVRGRNEGKTTDLIKWLMAGKEQPGYPHWNRVIVCLTNRQVIWTTDFLRRYITEAAWSPQCEQLGPHLHEPVESYGHTGVPTYHERVMSDIYKAVWGLSDLEANSRGTRDFEYAIDDADRLFDGWRWSFSMIRLPPTIIVINGELYNPE